MHDNSFWYLTIGIVLGLMSVISNKIEKLPISSSIIYFIIGIFLGPWGLGKVDISFRDNTRLLEVVAEIAVLISVFAAGLKLKIPTETKKWFLALQLATVSMIFMIAGISLFSITMLGLSTASAILLGAILAPTDPVLASAVQVKSPEDSDWLRFNLSAEAALNDGTAFPFVILGLGLLGLESVGSTGWEWLLVDVLWAISGAVFVGIISGIAAAQVIAYYRDRSSGNAIFEDLFSLGFLCTVYAASVFLHTYGFVACFFAGLAFRRANNIFEDSSQRQLPKTTKNVLLFNEQLERLVEFLVVIALGIMISNIEIGWREFLLAIVIFFVIRPLSILLLVLPGSLELKWKRIALMSWFGVRGVGSIYYLAFALNHGLKTGAQQFTNQVVVVVAFSILLHGLTSGPLMKWYEADK